MRQNVELQLQRAEKNPNMTMAKSFPRTLRKRLDKWESLRSNFRQRDENKQPADKSKRNELSGKTQAWLKAFGVEETYLGYLSSKTKPYLVVATVWNAALSEKRINSLGGYLNMMLRKNAKLRDGLSTLALAYDKADAETRLQMELGIRIDDPQLIKTLTENGSALKVAQMLWDRYETLDPVAIAQQL